MGLSFDRTLIRCEDSAHLSKSHVVNLVLISRKNLKAIIQESGEDLRKSKIVGARL